MPFLFHEAAAGENLGQYGSWFRVAEVSVWPMV